MAYVFSLCVLFSQYYDLSTNQKSNICKYEKQIRAQAKINKIQPELLASVIFVESAFHPSAISRAGACGLATSCAKVDRWKRNKRQKVHLLAANEPRYSN